MAKYDDFIAWQTDVDVISENLRTYQEDPRAANKTAALTKLRPYAFRAIPAAAGYASPANVPEAMVPQEAGTTLGVSNFNSSNILARSLDDVVSSTPDKIAESLLRAKPVFDKLAPEHREIVKTFQLYLTYADLTKRYEAKEPLNDEEMQAVKQATAIGYSAIQENHVRKQMMTACGVSDEDIVKRAGALAMKEIEAGYIEMSKLTSIALQGLKEQTEKIKADYKSKAGAVKMSDLGRNAYKTLASGNLEEFNTAKAVLYQTHKAAA